MRRKPEEKPRVSPRYRHGHGRDVGPTVRCRARFRAVLADSLDDLALVGLVVLKETVGHAQVFAHLGTDDFGGFDGFFQPYFGCAACAQFAQE